jgi:hypothetical protein
MLKNPFRRRAVTTAALPPVSAASVPGPLHSGLTGSLPVAPTPALLAGRAPVAPLRSVPAVAAPPPVQRSTYRVRFDGSIPDLIARQATRGELAAVVVGHVRPYARASHAVIDAEMPFILVRCDDQTVARATFEVLPTGGVR